MPVPSYMPSRKHLVNAFEIRSQNFRQYAGRDLRTLPSLLLVDKNGVEKTFSTYAHRHYTSGISISVSFLAFDAPGHAHRRFTKLYERLWYYGSVGIDVRAPAAFLLTDLHTYRSAGGQARDTVEAIVSNAFNNVCFHGAFTLSYWAQYKPTRIAVALPKYLVDDYPVYVNDETDLAEGLIQRAHDQLTRTVFSLGGIELEQSLNQRFITVQEAEDKKRWYEVYGDDFG